MSITNLISGEVVIWPLHEEHDLARTLAFNFETPYIHTRLDYSNVTVKLD